MKGGVELNVLWKGKSIDEAVTFFLENSTFRIFTNSSISCITLIAKLNQGIKSPFISIDSLNFARDITSLLLKIMPSTAVILKPGSSTDKAAIPGRIPTYDGIEINSYATIERETQTQKDIFRKSIISPISFLDSLCPALIHVINPVPDKNVWKNKFLHNTKIITRPGQVKMNEMVAINQIFSAVNMVGNRPSNVSIIIMEFMEGYKVLTELTAHPNYARFQQFALYQIHQLHLLGYLHGDSHTGNIMIHPDIPYFMAKPKPTLGIIKIIDFGRTAPLFPAEKLMIQNPNYDFSLITKERIFKIVFGTNAVLTPDISSLLQALISRLNLDRAVCIQDISTPRLTPFYDLMSIPEGERSSDKLLRVLFPESLYGGFLQNSEKINYLNNTGESLQYIKMNDSTGITIETENFITLSEAEQKMTIEDFKNIFSGVLTQNDNETTFNVSQFLKDNLVTTTTKGGKYKKYKPKSKKNKTHKKRKYRKYRKSARVTNRKTIKKYKNRR